MKKTVLTFGLISGALAILTMLTTIPFLRSMEHGKADALGYTSMVLSALLVFFGIRSFREKTGSGRISFGRGLAVGVLITLVSWACFAAAFQIVYFKVVPDFGDKFSACMVERVRASGGSQQKIDEAAKRARTFKGLWDNPLTNAALTFATSVPIGLAVSAISAAILRKR
jgi:uncharacterized protein DUF4199